MRRVELCFDLCTGSLDAALYLSSADVKAYVSVVECNLRFGSATCTITSSPMRHNHFNNVFTI